MTALVLIIATLIGLLMLLGRRPEDYLDHGDATHAGPHTLAHYTRQELRQGWDREAAGCGPWQGSRVTESARTLRWRER